jgi:hypothetical protein
MRDFSQGGFKVEYADGSTVDERSVVWDAIGGQPIKSLMFVHYESGDIVASLTDADQYYFANEAMTCDGDIVHSGKIFGSVSGDSVIELRVNLLSNPIQITQHQLSIKEFGFIASVLRDGI